MTAVNVLFTITETYELDFLGLRLNTVTCIRVAVLLGISVVSYAKAESCEVRGVTGCGGPSCLFTRVFGISGQVTEKSTQSTCSDYKDEWVQDCFTLNIAGGNGLDDMAPIRCSTRPGDFNSALGSSLRSKPGIGRLGTSGNASGFLIADRLVLTVGHLELDRKEAVFFLPASLSYSEKPDQHAMPWVEFAVRCYEDNYICGPISAGHTVMGRKQIETVNPALGYSDWAIYELIDSPKTKGYSTIPLRPVDSIDESGPLTLFGYPSQPFFSDELFRSTSEKAAHPTKALISDACRLDKKFDRLMFHRIPVAYGLSGGPIVNSGGNVVAIQSSAISSMVNSYNFGTETSSYGTDALFFASCFDFPNHLDRLRLPNAATRVNAILAEASQSRFCNHLSKLGLQISCDAMPARGIPLIAPDMDNRPLFQARPTRRWFAKEDSRVNDFCEPTSSAWCQLSQVETLRDLCIGSFFHGTGSEHSSVATHLGNQWYLTTMHSIHGVGSRSSYAGISIKGEKLSIDLSTLVGDVGLDYVVFQVMPQLSVESNLFTGCGVEPTAARQPADTGDEIRFIGYEGDDAQPLVTPLTPLLSTHRYHRNGARVTSLDYLVLYEDGANQYDDGRDEVKGGYSGSLLMNRNNEWVGIHNRRPKDVCDEQRHRPMRCPTTYPNEYYPLIKNGEGERYGQGTSIHAIANDLIQRKGLDFVCRELTAFRKLAQCRIRD